MRISREKFEELVAEAYDKLPEDTKGRLFNVAILTGDYPSDEQKEMAGIKKGFDLLGIFEGFGQSGRIAYGAILPDRITIFRRAVAAQSESFDDAKQVIFDTLKHEIAHHFGSNEEGARKAAKNKKSG